MTEYYIPTGSGDAEYVEKRSRFLGKVRHVESEEEARAFIEAVKKQYHDARHNCWCYLLKNGVLRYSDDGEPQGTVAGVSQSGGKVLGAVDAGAGDLLAV